MRIQSFIHWLAKITLIKGLVCLAFRLIGLACPRPRRALDPTEATSRTD